MILSRQGNRGVPDWKKWSLTIGFLAFLLVVTMNVGLHIGFAANIVIQDDFSTDSGKWTLLGNATRTSDGKIMLTPSAPSKVGTIWLKQTITPPYTVTFKFLMTGTDPSAGADGITFMFNKLQNIVPISGGGMGFEINNGYGVEFDSYSNPWDPRYDHISLFKNNPDHSLSPALSGVRNDTFENAQWHTVKVNVSATNVKVYLDNMTTPKINWNGALDPKYSGIGFSASTGALFSAQSIDDVTITKPGSVTGVSSSIADGAYSVGSVIPIQVTFNDSITVTGSPKLSLNNNNRTAIYAGGSGTNTLTFNYSIAAGDNTAELNYLSTSSLSGGTFIDSLGNTAVTTLPDTNAVNSLGGSKQIVIDTAVPTGTLAITGGNPDTNTVTLNLTAADGTGSGVSQMRFSNDNTTWSAWETYISTKSYSLPSGTGIKNVYVQFMDKANNKSVSSNVTITPPIANSTEWTSNEDLPVSHALIASNPDGRALIQYSIVSYPSKGSLSINPTTGVFNYIPIANANGADLFSYKVSDGILYSNVATISLSITPINDAPVSFNGTLNTNEDVPVAGKLTATDVDNTSLTYSIVSNPTQGTLSINASTGTYTYTPNLNSNGSDIFTFKVSDGELYSNIATVNITIQPVNDAPVATNGSYTTLEDTPKTGSLNATDIEGSNLTYRIVANGNKGTAVITNSNTFTYTPNLNTNGTDTFTFQAFDGSLYSNVGTVVITITPVNDAPSFVKGSDQSVVVNSGTQTISLWASSISPGPTDELSQSAGLYFVVINDNSAIFTTAPAISPSGTLTYTPSSVTTGTSNVTVALHDGGGTTNGGMDTITQTFTITVMETPSIPITFGDTNINPVGWTKNVTITPKVISQNALSELRWAPGELTTTNFLSDSNLGKVFSTSFEVIANGSYTIFAKNNNGNCDTSKITISNIDRTAPTITLNNGDQSLTVPLGSTFVDPGAVVTDNSFSNAQIVTIYGTPNLNTNKVGPQTLYYNYTDEASNPTTVERIVNVIDTTPPVITLVGSNTITIKVGEAFTDPGVSVYDNSGEELTALPSGSVNSTQVGSYTITYNASDASHNNAISITRTVNVVDTSPPIISNIHFSSTGWTKNLVNISATFDGTGSTILTKKWAAGEQSINYFDNGTVGQTIINNNFNVNSNNVYTIYAQDSSGNETIQTVAVSNIDTTLPTGNISINQGSNTTDSIHVTLQLNGNDSDSGISQMRISNAPFGINSTIAWETYNTNKSWDLAAGVDGPRTVFIQFKDAAGNESNVQIATIKVDTTIQADFSSLSVDGFPFTYDPRTASYIIEVGPKVDKISLTAVTLNPDVAASITGTTFSSIGSVYTIDINNTSSFELQLKKGNNVFKSFPFHINRWLGLATSNANGTEATLIFHKPLNITTLKPKNFNFTNGGPTVTNVIYDNSNPAYPTVRLVLTGTPANDNAWLLNVNGVLTTDEQQVNMTNISVITPANVRQIRSDMDLQNDGIHIDDIVKYLTTLQNVNGVNQYKEYDIIFLLQQI